MNITEEQLKALLSDMYGDDTILLADGLHQAFVGVSYDATTSTLRSVYSVVKCIEVFIKDGMTEDEAWEYFEYNVQGSYVGPQTPVWIHEIEFD